MSIRALFNIHTIKKVLPFGVGGIILVSCSTSVHLEEGQLEIRKVNIVTDNPKVSTAQLRNYVTQLPGRLNGHKQHPVLDSLQTRMSCDNLVAELHNEGYLGASATSYIDTLSRKADVTYSLTTGNPYFLRNITYDIQDHAVDSILTADFAIHNRQLSHLYGSPLVGGEQFSVTALNSERSLIVNYLQDNGYFRFTKDFIRFEADTVPGKHLIDLTLVIIPYRRNSSAPPEAHPYYKIGSVNYASADAEPIRLRPSVLKNNTSIIVGQPYNATAVKDTYTRFGRLGAVRYSNIRFDEVSDSILNCNINLSTSKANTISFQPEGTNTAGNLGAAASLTYANRNIFHGSELLSVELRGAFEAISGLEGYDGNNYVEYGVESKLSFPRLLAPFVSHNFRHSSVATSELSVSYNLQNRPEFHRRVLRAAWRYRWNDSRRHRQWRLDLIDLNYIYMPWISETFKHDYLDSASNRNAILRYNYEDLFIMKIGIGMTYNNKNNAFKWNIESSGNLLGAVANIFNMQKNADGHYSLFNIAFAQYVKGDIEGTHRFQLAPRTTFVIHGALGVAYPYGNSSVLPFEKRYFSGGANSVRGWSVRGLGPGTFQGTDGRIDFINQTGDIKIDFNMEYRTFLFWKISGALFVDAGNIWTIRDYADQPGGQFRFSEFYKQFGVAYGAGVRFNFGYFILRFDMGMKAIDPAYTDSRQHYPIFHPDLKHDFAFHFAVGLPF